MTEEQWPETTAGRRCPKSSARRSLSFATNVHADDPRPWLQRDDDFFAQPPQPSQGLLSRVKNLVGIEGAPASSPVRLIPPDEFDYQPTVTDADRAAESTIRANLADFQSWFIASPVEGAMHAELPAPKVDRRTNQSAVRHQGDRDTCVAFAATSLMDARGHAKDPLSAQHAHYKFMHFEQIPQGENRGIRTTDAPRYLSDPTGRIGLDRDWPYVGDRQAVITAAANGSWSPPALIAESHGIASYMIIRDEGPTGPSIRNVRYLEALLAAGYDIAVGVTFAFVMPDNPKDAIQPMLENELPLTVAPGHAMAIVGYDRDRSVFIIKNSFGTSWGDNGYGYFSYAFAKTYFRYGFVVDGVTTVDQAP